MVYGEALRVINAMDPDARQLNTPVRCHPTRQFVPHIPRQLETGNPFSVYPAEHMADAASNNAGSSVVGDGAKHVAMSAAVFKSDAAVPPTTPKVQILGEVKQQPQEDALLSPN